MNTFYKVNIVLNRMFNREICNDGKNKVILLNIKLQPPVGGGKSRLSELWSPACIYEWVH